MSDKPDNGGPCYPLGAQCNMIGDVVRYDHPGASLAAIIAKDVFRQIYEKNAQSGIPLDRTAKESIEATKTLIAELRKEGLL